MSIESGDPNLSLDAGDTALGQPPSAVLAARGAESRPASAGRAEDGHGLTREARRRIGRNLRLLYEEVLTQPLPDRFAALLADLAARSDPRGPA
jgi:hypothetical protein